ncbi:hypothetical protein HanPI659440_Chr01g0028141 [Helianthus annuus]|nr:hypothetical protein HanPI659440_Chr01g0028141 [Helianthus annuus]
MMLCFLFAGLDSVVDMKQVVADEFVDGHLHEFTYCSNENVHLYKQAYDKVSIIIYDIVCYLKSLGYLHMRIFFCNIL